VATNQKQLLEALDSAIKRTDASTRATPDVKISFVFTGQGAQWPQMGRELFSEPTFRDSICRSRNILRDLGSSWDLIEELSREGKDSRLKEAELAQPATTAIQIALVDLVRRWGIVPDSVVGHSSGEIGAAYTAGYLSRFMALKASYFRGFSASISKAKGLGKGGMMAVGVGEQDVAKFLTSIRQGVAVVACQNSPSSTTVSGDDLALTELAEILDQEGIFNRRLNVDTAYHSHHMQAAASEYKDSLGNIEEHQFPNATGITLFSSVTGSKRSYGFDADYWVSNLVSKVRFCDALQTLCRSEDKASRSQSHRVFIEIGPHAALAGPARQCIADLGVPVPYNYTSVLSRGIRADHSAMVMVGSVFDSGYPVDLTAVSTTDPTPRTASVLYNLPAYSWDHSKRHWHESRLSRDYRLRKNPYHDLLGIKMTDNTSLRPSWRHMVGVERLPWLADHVVDEQMIFPAAGYLCMAIEAALQLNNDLHPEKRVQRVSLKDVSFLKSLVIPAGRARVEVQLVLNPIEVGHVGMQHGFSVTAFSGDDEWNEHCTGTVAVEYVAEQEQNFTGIAITYKEMLDTLDPASTKTVESAKLYEELHRVGNTYGPTFAGIETFSMDSSRAVSTVSIPDIVSGMPASYMRPHAIHPSTLDILLHGSLPLVNHKLGAGSVMPVHIDQILISLGVENAPGTLLSAVCTITSSHFRSAQADLLVFPGAGVPTSIPVISMSGMEMRSLASDPSEDAALQDPRDICYEVKWDKDEQFLSADSLHTPSQENREVSSGVNSELARSYGLMSQYLKHKSFKQSSLSVINISNSLTGATLPFLEALKPYGVIPSIFDSTSEVTNGTGEELDEWSGVVNFKPLNIERDPVEQGFEQGLYDIVLAVKGLHGSSSLNLALPNVCRLLRPDGVLLLIESTNPETESSFTVEKLSEELSKASLKVQLALTDSSTSSNLTFVVARAVVDVDVAPPSPVRIISEPGLPQGLGSFTKELSGALVSKGMEVVTSMWGKQSHDDAITIVIDNGSKPILEDVAEDKFQHVRNLLKGPSKVIWISAQDDEKDAFNPTKHLITGLSRTAHAENEDLQMVTLDVQQSLARLMPSRLLEILLGIIQSLTRDKLSTEREFVYNGTDMLIPRVIPSETLNRQISTKDQTITESKTFVYSVVPLMLDNQRKNSLINPVFIEGIGYSGPLATGSVEIDAKAFGVPRMTMQASTSLNEYSGIVTAVGSEVSDFKPGDRVIAYDKLTFANRLRVHATQVQLLPHHISFATAAALPVSFMTACHALVDIAEIQPGQAVLIDGASSEVGQAALTMAQHLGAQVIAAVSRTDEAKFVTETLKLPSSHVIPREGYLCKRQVSNLVGAKGVDVVLACSVSHATTEINESLKPYGILIRVQPRAGSKPQANTALRQSSNATISTFDLESLIQAKPHKISGLLRKVMELIRGGMPTGAGKITTMPMKDCEQAIKLAREEGSMSQIVLEVAQDSIVKVTRSNHILPKLVSQATYVIAGGMGDVGKRLLRLMAKAGAKYLVTLSRNGSTPAEHNEFEKELQGLNAGCTLFNLKANVAVESSVQSAFSEIKAKGLPPVRGVIQTTVVLKDSTLDNMSAEVFNSVLEAKSHGTLNLRRVFGSDALTFFISCSSVVNVIGTSGQANYNAGNSLQDALAQFGNDSNCFNMSLNIGTIEDATVNNDTIVNSLRRQGLTPVTANELLAYFEYALSADAREGGSHQIVIGFTPKTLAASNAVNGTAHTPMFTHVRKVEQSSTDASIKTKTFADVVAKANDEEEIVKFVAEVIAKTLADLVAIDSAEVSLNSSILDFGLDSLIAIELRNWIMREFNAPIQSSEVLDSHDIWSLAQKVTSRSRLTDDKSTESGSSGSDAMPSSTLPTSRSRSEDSQNRAVELSPLPVPDLSETLRMFVSSRKAFATPKELEETEIVVEDFKKSGLELQQALKADPYGEQSRLDFYNTNIHLERREKLQDHALFYIGHLTDGAPTHTQAERAAIITVSTLTWKKALENGTLEQNKLNETPLCMETCKWMFHTYQKPEQGLDKILQYPPNANIIVMRQGHLYQVDVREEDDFASLTGLFENLIASSQQAMPPVSVLTTQGRDEWARLRAELEELEANAVTLRAIESAAFVICLDETAPVTAAERCTSIMVNDLGFTNRWLDKTTEFTVAANGVSSILCENGTLDGMSTRQLHEYTTDQIFKHKTPSPNEKPTPISKVQELTFHLSPNMLKAIKDQTAHNLARYEPIAATRDYISELNRKYLGSKKLRSKGTVLLTILLATRMFYGYFEPVWETVTIAKFAKGRIDWLQSLTPDIALWIDAVLKFMQTGEGDTVVLLRTLREAAIGHAQALRQVADGRGYVEPLYSLAGVANREGKELPPLFNSTAWKYCDRHATPKRAKTDCLGSGGYLRMQEGGFLMPNPGSLFIHYEVHHTDPLVLVQGEKEDVEKFKGCLDQAVKAVYTIIKEGI
jgi:acyl transferase domain-containing protein/NADPH:quinone reductase-like Zn-dependent oxidoreductase/acyl carrier protein